MPTWVPTEEGVAQATHLLSFRTGAFALVRLLADPQVEETPALLAITQRWHAALVKRIADALTSDQAKNLGVHLGLAARAIATEILTNALGETLVGLHKGPPVAWRGLTRSRPGGTLYQRSGLVAGVLAPD